jgi:hypothetical protein
LYKHATLVDSPMSARNSVLVQPVSLIDRLPAPPLNARPRQRGRPRLYANTLFLKTLLIITLKSLYKVGGPLAVLEEPTQEERYLRKLGLTRFHGPITV